MIKMSTTLSVVLVDDEEKSRKVLRNLLSNYFPDVTLIGEASDVNEAYRHINEKHPDLVLLDIQMPGGDGFWLLKKWDEVPFEVIFVTSFDQHAIEAIKFSALDYLLKPVQVYQLRSAIDKAIRNKERRLNMQAQIVTLLDNLDSANDDKRIAVHVHDKVRFLNMKHIMYLEIDGHYSMPKLVNGEQFTTTKPLSYFEELLTPDKGFVRIHKGYIINVNFIKEYSKGDLCILTMIDGKQFEVARRKKQEVLERLKK